MPILATLSYEQFPGIFTQEIKGIIMFNDANDDIVFRDNVFFNLSSNIPNYDTQLKTL